MCLGFTSTHQVRVLYGENTSYSNCDVIRYATTLEGSAKHCVRKGEGDEMNPMHARVGKDHRLMVHPVK